MMKAVNTAGTLISLRNWSTESIPVIPPKDKAPKANRAYCTLCAVC